VSNNCKTEAAMATPELPPELWSLILSFLDTTSLVRVTTAYPWLRFLARSLRQEFYTGAELCVVGELCNLTQLCVGLYDRVTEDCLAGVFSQLYHLTQVTINTDGGCLTDTALLSLLNNNPNLVSLNLENCDSLTSDSLATLPVHCTQLSTLKLCWARRITDSCVNTILSGCARLCQLTLYSCHNITNVNTDSCTMLTKLSITNCSQLGHVNTGVNNARLTSVILTGSKQLSDQTVCQLAKNCQDITELRLSFCSDLTDLSITILAENCQKLSVLNLQGCPQVTSASVNKLNKVCQVFRW